MKEKESEREKASEVKLLGDLSWTGRDERRQEERERKKNFGAWAMLPAAFC
jgi:hypothetical protein